MLVFGTLLNSVAASADSSYPHQAIRMVVPFAAGGAADAIGRSVADELQKELGQPLVVVNRGGAGTVIGVNYVAKAPADGYTLLLSGDAATINTASGRALPYDLMKELVPISTLFSGAQFVLVNKNSQFRTLDDLVKRAKAHPGELKYGSSGIGTSIHLAEESFNKAAGIKATHVPYRGVAPAINDLMAGLVDYVIAGSSVATPAVQGGSLRALAINDAKRSAQLPEVPTAMEQGVNVQTKGWYGLWAPSGTPPDVIDKLNSATQAVLKSEALSSKFEALGGEAKGASLADTRKFVANELESFRKLIRDAHLKLD
ncbi:Tat pathway signal protein [Advenella kashmirensis W13003]|uniref:Tat pathway signal protein n=2 Tax=Advenella kashmirensis TaxID=310575 RepID=V8QP54_9BURK|nr:Tat pathway signal protein [Advenella kashmirensis W13003]